MSISPDTEMTDLAYKIDADGEAIQLEDTDSEFVDVGGDLKASAGDFFLITGLEADAEYTLYLIHEPSGDVVDSVVFTTLEA